MLYCNKGRGHQESRQVLNLIFLGSIFGFYSNPIRQKNPGHKVTFDRVTFYPITNMINSEWNIIAAWHASSILSMHNYSYEATANTYYSTVQDDINYPGFAKYPIMYDEGTVVYDMLHLVCCISVYHFMNNGFKRNIKLSSYWNGSRNTNLLMWLVRLYFWVG